MFKAHICFTSGTSLVCSSRFGVNEVYSQITPIFECTDGISKRRRGYSSEKRYEQGIAVMETNQRVVFFIELSVCDQILVKAV